MANIRERRDKNGKITAYLIRVHKGRDSFGKELKPYSSKFIVEGNWSEAKCLKEANKAAVIFEKNCLSGLVANEKQTFQNYAEYVMTLKEKNQKVRTVERYRQLLERIIPAIGHMKLTEIRPQHLNQFYDNLAEEGQNKTTGGKLANKTILEHHRLISTIMNQAEKEMLLPYNPARRATPPKKVHTQANYFQIDELNKIVECLENEPIKWKTLTHLLMITGCRRGEIIGLKWSKIDFENGTLFIDTAILKTKDNGTYETTTKTGKSRFVPIPLETISLLKEYRLWQKKEKLANGDRWENSEFVFTNEIGQAMHPDGINLWLIRFAKRHNLQHINPHAFRHSYASVLISKGIDIVTVSKTLGHESVSTTTDIYAELMKQASAEASQCIADSILRNVK